MPPAPKRGQWKTGAAVYPHPHLTLTAGVPVTSKSSFHGGSHIMASFRLALRNRNSAFVPTAFHFAPSFFHPPSPSSPPYHTCNHEISESTCQISFSPSSV